MIVKTLWFLFLGSITLAMVAVGSIYKDRCPIDNKIPLWLIVSGSVGFLTTSANCCLYFSKSRKYLKQNQFMTVIDDLRKQTDNEVHTSAKSCNNYRLIATLFFTFFFVSMILGFFWVYKIKNRLTNDPADSANYCHQICFYFAFWIVTISNVLLVFALGCLCIICICSVSYLKLDQFSKNIDHREGIRAASNTIESAFF